ncbi:membrane-associated phospholipid phosphatase [Sphaerochaeta pleomorpha str. Grapes]|uniref:Membrane-associated phospholipid phosphatase n=1 Tax=Sphaerochaeta pleomorpha (strain ATCC BAA-1885 / DSM 22778 / Grapes) TaxID=158190 RepID=G8QQ31_SPHPG|nr:phosphatase PAP2 family protein [Sphaerochaeta pleomorpha]AEV28608.1 membrane-associated phospholipid phosphatase [Sphaerochaeta pleomorpha str. Grapes]
MATSQNTAPFCRRRNTNSRFILGLFLFLSFSFLASFPILAEPIEIADPSPSVFGNTFQLDLKTDSLLLSGGLSLIGGSYLIDHFMLEEISTVDANTLDIHDVNWFDRWAMQPYDQTMDKVSDVLDGISLLLPGLLMLSPETGFFTVGVMYTEAIVLSYGLKEVGKTLLHRTRPYMYFDLFPEDKVADGDWNRSFPSGHTTMAFTSAAFTSYVFSSYFPDSKWKTPVILGSFAIATATAVLRVTSGNHFPTDVLGGAVIGTLSGFLVPYLHRTRPTNKLLASMNLIPNGLSFTFRV